MSHSLLPSHQTLTVPENQGKIRLDKFISTRLVDISRSHLQQLIKAKEVTVNNSSVKSSHLVLPGEIIQINIPPPTPSDLTPQNIPLNIIYEDEYLVVINKPAGLVVHPACGHIDGTLVNALLYHFNELSQIKNTDRPGIVHRLDKDTSGLLVTARDERTHANLSEQFKNKTIKREYLAIVCGQPSFDSGTVSTFIIRSKRDRRRMVVSKNHGKRAVTHYEMLEKFRMHSLIKLRLETGRTHQIRVHLAHLGSPVFGDPVYYGRQSQIQTLGQTDKSFTAKLLKNFERQALHARSLGFKHPATQEEMYFECSIPEDMEMLLTNLRNNIES